MLKSGWRDGLMEPKAAVGPFQLRRRSGLNAGCWQDLARDQLEVTAVPREGVFLGTVVACCATGVRTRHIQMPMRNLDAADASIASIPAGKSADQLRLTVTHLINKAC
jgi:hypothetical protein